MWLTAEQSNSSLIVDDAVMLKIFRRISPGEHPEAEMSRYLTAQGFANAPPLLGEVMPHRRPGTNAMRSPSRRASSATRAMPGPGRSTSSTAPSTTSASREAAAESRADDVADYHGLRRSDRPPARRDARGAGAADRRSGLRAARWPAARTSRPGSARAMALLTRRSMPSPRAPTGTTKRSKPMRRALLANSAALDQRAAAGWAQVRRRHADDAHPWRLPSRPGAGRQRRRLHHRFRGRAGAAARRAPRQGQPAGATSPACCARSTMPAATTLDPKNVGRQPRVAGDARRGSSRACARRAARPSSTPIATVDRQRPARPRQPACSIFFLIEKAAYEVAYEAANRPAWLADPAARPGALAGRILGDDRGATP